MSELPAPRRVLVTGSAGAIGRAVCRELLRRGHAVRGLDRAANPEVADSHAADLTDRAALDRAMEGIDTLLHLAAVPNDADFLTRLLPNNVVALFQVCDAARAFKVRRLILTSSVQVVGGLNVRGRWVRNEDGVLATNHYALTKVWAEEMGRMYAAAYGLSVLAVRPGWLPRDEAAARGVAKTAGPGGSPVYLSSNDAGRFYALAVEAEAPRPGEYAVLFATSRGPEGQGYDLEPARRLLGYEPKDTWPEGMAWDRSLAAATPLPSRV